MKYKVMSSILSLSLLISMSPSIANAGVMDGFNQKQDSIRLKGEILEYKVRNFSVEEQWAKYPNKIEDITIPKDFTVEPFTLDDFNVGHIPQMGEFKSYSDSQFEKNKQEYKGMYNGKRNALLSTYKGKEKSIDGKMDNAKKSFNHSKNDLSKEYNDTAKQLASMFGSKSKELSTNNDKAKKNAEKDMKDSYQQEVDRINKLMEDNKVDYWGKESDEHFANAQENYKNVKSKVERDTKVVNDIAKQFEQVLIDQKKRERQLRIDYDNTNLAEKHKDFFDSVGGKKPAGIDEFINGVKGEVDYKQSNFKQWDL